MLIWANRNEINAELVEAMDTMYSNDKIKGFKPWELSTILRQIQRHFGKRKDMSILDFGAGASPFGAYLNHIGYQFVTCLDIKRGWHPEINEESYNKKYDAHVKYFKTNIVSNYVGYHDVIFSASVLEHIKRRKKRIEIMKALAKHLTPGGLVIHIVDYGDNVNIKELIDVCGVSISYKPEDTPGCEEFVGPPEYAWLVMHNRIQLKSRTAFFNERQ
ncbi:class I SAM-dependent methyltransferase [bacterium]|nr:class I SAM-dependent methyltransferase [bacterium]